VVLQMHAGWTTAPDTVTFQRASTFITGSLTSFSLFSPTPLLSLLSHPLALTHINRHLSALRAAIPPNVNVYYRHDPPYYGFKDNSTTWCFRQAVLLGSNMYGFPDMVSAYEYRRVVYAGFGIQVRVEVMPGGGVGHSFGGSARSCQVVVLEALGLCMGALGLCMGALGLCMGALGLCMGALGLCMGALVERRREQQRGKPLDNPCPWRPWKPKQIRAL
jgi:hypothetical protein